MHIVTEKQIRDSKKRNELNNKLYIFISLSVQQTIKRSILIINKLSVKIKTQSLIKI